jgi:hypothetical protein
MKFTIYDIIGRPSFGYTRWLARTTHHVSRITFFALCLMAGRASADSVVQAQTTQVLFPINSLFGGAAYNKPITLTAANTLISDGQNIWAGTYTIIPASTTNPVAGLYPNTYLMTIAGVVKPARFTVPASTNILDVTTLLTSGPLFYFGTNGLANLHAGTNIVFATNSDGSITLNWGGSIGMAQITNLPSWLLTNGASGVTLFGTFIGDGSGLINLQAANLTGTVPWSNLPPNLITNFATGVTLSGTFSGNGSGLTNLNARALLVSNTFAIYPHLTGTNVFWSTQP